MEKALEAKEALELYGSQTKAAEVLGIARSTLQERLKKLATSGNDGLTFTSVPTGHHIKGVSTYYDKDGTPKAQWVKTRTEAFDPDAFIQYIKDGLIDVTPINTTKITVPTTNNDLLTVYPLADIHLGMLTWGEESGDDWDLNIAVKTISTNFEDLVQQSRNTDTAILLNLGDWFHINDSKNMTPRSGNILDVDCRYMKMLTTGVSLMTKMIQVALSKHSKIIVRNLPGNHDPESCLALTVALDAYFKNDSRVKIELDPSEFFFYRFGNTLIGANHGHRLKPVTMALKLAVEKSVDWGFSKYRYFYFGHVHHESVKEIGGVRVESFQTLAAKDAHAANGGYTSNRSLSAITISYSDGEIGRHKINL